MENQTGHAVTLGSVFDRTLRSLRGIPDVTETKATTCRTFTAVLEQAETWIVQTFRHRERGDFVAVEYVGPEGTTRLVLPPAVTATIARQSGAAGTKNRKSAARAEAARRKAAGIEPGFMKKRK